MINWPVEIVNNKYVQWYEKIVERAKTRSLPKGTYVEKHHIVPRSLGGDNSYENLVKLTAREHFLCHAMLVRFLRNDSYYRMSYALNLMISDTKKLTPYRYKPKSSALYKKIRENHAKANSALKSGVPAYNKGVPMSEEQKKKCSAAQKARMDRMRAAGIPLPNPNKLTSPEARKRNADARRGTKHTPESIQKNREANTGEKNAMWGRKQTDAARKIQSERALLRPKINCPHCGKVNDVSNHTRWHGDKCKHNTGLPIQFTFE